MERTISRLGKDRTRRGGVPAYPPELPLSGQCCGCAGSGGDQAAAQAGDRTGTQGVQAFGEDSEGGRQLRPLANDHIFDARWIVAGERRLVGFMLPGYGGGNAAEPLPVPHLEGGFFRARAWPSAR